MRWNSRRRLSLVALTVCVVALSACVAPQAVFASAPTVKTERPLLVLSREARPTASINPNGNATEFDFEWGTTESLGNHTTVESAGSGTTETKVGGGRPSALEELTPGTRYYYRAKAWNSEGTTWGAIISFVAEEPPTNVVKPAISSTPEPYVSVSATNGEWTHMEDKPRYGYQWKRCNAKGEACVNISGATGSKYTPTEADEGHDLLVEVEAENASLDIRHAQSEPSAVTARGTFNTFYYGTYPGVATHEITSGSDGNLWFTAENGTIGKASTSGETLASYSLPTGHKAIGIALGPDKNVWFTYLDQESKTGGCGIGKITPSGTKTEYALPEGSDPEHIIAGPDGNLWFAGGTKIGKITTSGTITEYEAALAIGGITSEPTGAGEGNIWFTEGTHYVQYIDTKGSFGTSWELPLESEPMGIVYGPEKDLWVAERKRGEIARLEPKLRERTEHAAGSPEDIVAGPDGSLWYTQHEGELSRMTTSGSVTHYTTIASGLTAGAEGRIWFTWGSAHEGGIGRMVG